MKRDLTIGNINGNLLYMAIPAILGSLTETVYSLVDMFWIGKISAEAVASITIFNSVYFLVWVLSSIIGISSVSLISQSYGAGNRQETAEAIEQTIVFKFIMAVGTMSVMSFALEPLLRFLTDDPQVLQYAMNYGRLRIFFLPVFFTASTFITALRCIGDSRKPMILTIMVALLNMVLDPILMFDTIPFLGLPGFGMGVAGAALATCLSSLVVFLFGFIILWRGWSNIQIRVRGLFHFNKEIDKKLILIGLPVGIEMTAREIAGIVIMKFLASYGTVIVAAFGISFRLTDFNFKVMMGLYDGGGAIVGQNLGAEKVRRAEETAYAAARLGFLILGLLAIIVAIFSSQIMGVFVNDAAVIASGSIVLRILMIGSVIFCVALSLGCAFNGAGYNFPFVISSLVGRWLVQIPFLFVVVHVLKLPYQMVAVSYLVAEVIESFILYYYFRKGAWKTHRVQAAS